MYEFHYNYIKIKFDAKHCFTDTERMVYEIKTEVVYKIFYGGFNGDFYENLFNFSDYPQDLKFFYPFNIKVINKVNHLFKGK